MDRETWMKELKKELGNRLGADYEIIFLPQKQGEASERLSAAVRKNSERIGIAVELKGEQSGWMDDVSGILKAASALVKEYRRKWDILHTEVVSEYCFADMKKHIVYALENRNSCPEALYHIPYENYLDMVKIFQLCISQGDETYSRTVTLEDLTEWGVDQEAVAKAADENTPEQYPPVIMAFKETETGVIIEKIGDTLEEMLEGLKNLMGEAYQMYAISNQESCYGARCMCYDGLLERIAGVWEDNILILPSSIHEFLVLPAMRSGGELPEFRELVFSMNREIVDEELVLSDSVYFYDRNMKQLRIAAEGDIPAVAQES